MVIQIYTLPSSRMTPKIKSQGIGPTSREVHGGIAGKSRVKFLGAGMASFGGALAAWTLP